MKRILARLINLLLIFTLVANLASCGTIFYPERKGQKPGKIDPTVAALDAIGLLFFIIPGVIAFAVDFNNNSIYLPHSSSSRKGSSKKFSEILSNQKLDQAKIEQLVRAQTGISINMDQANIEVIRLTSKDELESKLDFYYSHAPLAIAKN